MLFRASEFRECKQAAKIIRKMSGDHTSPNPFLDSTYGLGYPVQFPLQGDVRAFRQTGQDDLPTSKCVEISRKLPPPANLHKAIATRFAGGMAFRSLVFLLEISGETRLTNRRNVSLRILKSVPSNSGTGSRLQASTRTSQSVDDEVSKAVQFSYFPSAFVQSLKASAWLMSLLVGSVTINHVVEIKTTFSFFV